MNTYLPEYNLIRNWEKIEQTVRTTCYINILGLFKVQMK